MAWSGGMDVSSGGIRQVAPRAVSLQQQHQRWGRSRGAALLQQRQSCPSVCDPGDSQREAASFVPSSSPDGSACDVPNLLHDLVHVPGPRGQYRTVLRGKFGGVEAVVSGRQYIWWWWCIYEGIWRCCASRAAGANRRGSCLMWSFFVAAASCRCVEVWCWREGSTIAARMQTTVNRRRVLRQTRRRIGCVCVPAVVARDMFQRIVLRRGVLRESATFAASVGTRLATANYATHRAQATVKCP